MSLAKRDKEFVLPQISLIDYKQLEMDRVLTVFFERLYHKGYPSRLNRPFELTTEAFVDGFLEQSSNFVGFQEHRPIFTRWVETHLLDIVNRGKPNAVVASPRPLHGFAYRFRNKSRGRDYGAASHLYELIISARRAGGQRAIEHLRKFFFPGVDTNTNQISHSGVLDVETQVILRLPHESVSDAPDSRPSMRQAVDPLCIGAADLLAEDVQRLLFYQDFVPRSVMVDYLKIVFAFHLALYHLRLFKLLPALIRRQSGDPVCADCPMNPRSLDSPHGDCQHQIGILVDAAGLPGTQMSTLAEYSADVHYRRIVDYIRAHFMIKKLDEFADFLVTQNRLPRPQAGRFSVPDLLKLLGPVYAEQRNVYFLSRMVNTPQFSQGGDNEVSPEIRGILEMQLPPFETYVESVVALRTFFHRKYVIQCLDSLLLKNRDGALLAQGRTRNAPRRFVLDGRLLEVLLQIAVLQPGGELGYYTAELRIDQLLCFLRERYGLYIDQLPQSDGFGEPTLTDRKTLRANRAAFIERLREIGFYRDMSDAYVTQTVTPRYTIAKNAPNPNGASA